MTDKFWMVLRSPDISNGLLDRKDRPGFVHETGESAEQEAERLALLNNASYLILEGVAWVHPTPTTLSGAPYVVPTYELLP